MLKEYAYWNDKSNIYAKFPKLLINETDKPIFDALDIEIDKLKELYVDLVNQCFVDTATWGLDNWEKLVAIKTDYTLDYEARRSNVKAEMRRQDITTVEAIKRVSEAYSNGECAVVEDFKDYSFEIRFIGSRGIPRDIKELDKVICKIKPRHLAHKYVYAYLIWKELDGFNKTWDQWESLNLTWDDLEVYSESGRDNIPPSINNLVATKITNNSIEIEYEITDENTETVKHFISVSGMYTEKEITSLVDKTSTGYKYSVTNLEEGKEYTVKIKCTDEGGLSRESFINVSTVKTEPINNPPKISNLRGVKRTENSIEIQYFAEDEDVETVKHYITVSNICTNKNITNLIEKIGNEYKYVISGLTSNNSYSISIKCEDKKGLSSVSNSINISTTVPKPVNKAPAVNNFRYTTTTENSITIEYSISDEDTETVKHFISVSGLYADKEITNEITKSELKYAYTITDLESGKEYLISIKCEDKEGLSGISSSINVSTKIPKPVNRAPIVSNLTTIGNPTKNKIDISYKVADEDLSKVSHYLTVTNLFDKKDITSDKSGMGGNYTFSINNLNPDTEYNIKIICSDGELEGSSDFIKVKTDKEEIIPPKPGTIYGFKIDETVSSSSSAVSYIEENKNFANAEGIDMGGWKNKWPFSEIKPVFFKNGKVINYLKEFEYTRMIDGIEIDDSGDVMISYPKIFWSVKRNANFLEVRISDKKINDSYTCPAFMYRGKECPNTYIGGYFASEINGRMKSLPFKSPITNKGKLDLRNLACRNGRGYEQMTPQKLDLLKILEILLYKNLDSQRSLGVGPNLNLVKGQTGATRLFGLLSGDSSQFSNVKFLGIENLWGAGTTYLDGVEIKNKKLFVNQTGHPADGTEQVAEFTGMTGWNTSQAGYMSKASGTNKAVFFPMEFNGSDYQFYSDDCYIETDNSDFSCFFGGDSSGGLYKNGLFYIQQFTDPQFGGSGRLLFGRLTYTG